MAKVSIIVPVYNVEKYLDRCVRSILNQTLQDIEIILVDDGSPDGCPAKCDEWTKKDSRIKVIHKTNQGLGYARNSGLTKASGTYVTFLDSDDMVNMYTYETCYEHAIKDNLDVCYFAHVRFEDESKINSREILNGTYQLFQGKEECNDYLLEMIGILPSEKEEENYSMSACMGIFKKEIFDKYSISFVSERGIASEDLVFHLDFLPHVRKIGKLSNEFYYYFKNPKSITTTYDDGKRDRMLRLLDVVNNNLKSHFPANVYKPHFYSQILRIYRVILRFESKRKNSYRDKKRRIRQLCQNPILDTMYKDPIIKQYNLFNKGIIFCMKHQMVLPIVLAYKFLR